MEHPLIPDLSQISDEDLQSRITDLTRKLSWAQRNNAHLAHQIRMALESYRSQISQRQRAREQQQGPGPDFSDRIDIS